MSVFLLIAAVNVFSANNVVILLDSSGSMDYYMEQTSRMEAAHIAIESLITQIPEDTVLGLITFDGWVFDPVKVGSNRKKMIEKVKSVYPSGGTPLGEYMEIAGTKLLELRKKDKAGLFRLVIITDGEAGDRLKMHHATADILSRGILLNVIGCKMDEDHSLKSQAHSYRSADDLKGLKNALNTSVAEVKLDEDVSKIQEQFDEIAGLNNDVCQFILTSLASQAKANQGIDEPYETVNGEQIPAPVDYFSLAIFLFSSFLLIICVAVYVLMRFTS